VLREREREREREISVNEDCPVAVCHAVIEQLQISPQAKRGETLRRKCIFVSSPQVCCKHSLDRGGNCVLTNFLACFDHRVFMKNSSLADEAWLWISLVTDEIKES